MENFRKSCLVPNLESFCSYRKLTCPADPPPDPLNLDDQQIDRLLAGTLNTTTTRHNQQLGPVSSRLLQSDRLTLNHSDRLTLTSSDRGASDRLGEKMTGAEEIELDSSWYLNNEDPNQRKRTAR